MAVHGLYYAGRSVDVSDLVTQAGNPPGLGGLVDGDGDVGVQVRALFEDVVEG